MRTPVPDAFPECSVSIRPKASLNRAFTIRLLRQTQIGHNWSENAIESAAGGILGVGEQVPVHMERHGRLGVAKSQRTFAVTGQVRGKLIPYAYRQIRKAMVAMAIGQPCEACGRPLLYGQKLEVDHRIPVALGGGEDLSNLRVVHRGDNRRAGGALGARIATARRRAREAELRSLRARGSR